MAEDILEKIYRENSKRIYLYVLSVCCNAHVAEDITQETFVKALISLPDDCVSVTSWLYRVATNLTYDYFRNHKKEINAEFSDATVDFAVSDRMLQTEDNQILYHCIRKLDKNERMVITLHYFSGFRQSEISVITGLSYSNVRVIMSRAREKLKKYLKEEQI